MRIFSIIVISLATLMFDAAGTAIAEQQELPDVTEDGLYRIADSKMAVVYIEPDADLARYQRIKLLGAYVAFKKNWERDQRSRSTNKLKITSKDVEKIKTDLAQEFHAIFKKTLEDGGYAVVEESAEDVLLIRPAIINLDVNAPDTPHGGRTSAYTASAGEMTLYLEIVDSVTGDLIVKALDRSVDNATHQGFRTWTNSSTNKRASERILGGWATILLDTLNEAKQQ
jgi:hypothetical protein